MKDLDGSTLCFTIPRMGQAQSEAAFIEKDEVPDFEGDCAWFEIVKRRIPDCSRPRWTVVKRVEPPD